MFYLFELLINNRGYIMYNSVRNVGRNIGRTLEDFACNVPTVGSS